MLFSQFPDILSTNDMKIIVSHCSIQSESQAAFDYAGRSSVDNKGSWRTLFFFQGLTHCDTVTHLPILSYIGGP